MLSMTLVKAGVGFAVTQMDVEVHDGPWAEYQVYVKTGDRIGASTSADVKLTIYGEKGCTPPITLTTSKYNKVKFQRGKVSKPCRIGLDVSAREA